MARYLLTLALTDMDFDINYWSVLVAALAPMVLGALWYSPILFGNIWMKAAGLSSDMAKNMGAKQMGLLYGGQLVLALLMSYVLAHFIVLGVAFDFVGGATIGFWIWLGFVVPVMAGQILWEQKSWKYFAIGASFQLIALALMGGILAVWPA